MMNQLQKLMNIHNLSASHKKIVLDGLVYNTVCFAELSHTRNNKKIFLKGWDMSIPHGKNAGPVQD
jgi:hypothetical protein